MIDHRKSFVIAKIGTKFIAILKFLIFLKILLLLAKYLKDLYKELINLLNSAEMKELLPSDNLKVFAFILLKLSKIYFFQ